jgi:hypothetical protein
MRSYLSHEAYERILFQVDTLPRRIGARAYDNTAFTLLQYVMLYLSFVHI